MLISAKVKVLILWHCQIIFNCIEFQIELSYQYYDITFEAIYNI